MKTKNWLKKIEKLRLKHTHLTQAGKWLMAQTVREKIITAWTGYHAAESQEGGR